MQLNLLVPAGVTPGGYVPVVLTVGNQRTVDGAVWIAVGGLRILDPISSSAHLF